MFTEPPLEVAPVSVKAPLSVKADAPAGSVKSVPLSCTTGLPTTLGVSVSPTSASLTEKLPVMAVMFCAEASTASSTAEGSVVSLSTGPSFVPVMVTVIVAMLSVPLPSRIA